MKFKILDIGKYDVEIISDAEMIINIGRMVSREEIIIDQYFFNIKIKKGPFDPKIIRI